MEVPGLEINTSGAYLRKYKPNQEGQPGLQSEFQDSQSYTEKPCLEKTLKKSVIVTQVIQYKNKNKKPSCMG